jgi:hypothetical protein
VPAVSSSQAPALIRHLAGCHLTAPLQAATPLDRSGLQHARACLRCPLLTAAGRSGRIPPPSVLGQDTRQISRGQLSYRRCIDAGCIKHSPIVDGGLCCGVPARPGCTTPRIRFVSLAPHLRSTLPSDPTSRCRPGASLVLRLHAHLDGRLALPSMTACTAHTPGLSRAVHRVGSIPLLGLEKLQAFHLFALDFGHSGIDPLQTRQERAGAVRKLGEVWWGGRHHEMTQPPMPLQLSPHLAAIFLLSGCGENGQSRVA